MVVTVSGQRSVALAPVTLSCTGPSGTGRQAARPDHDRVARCCDREAEGAIRCGTPARGAVLGEDVRASSLCFIIRANNHRIAVHGNRRPEVVTRGRVRAAQLGVLAPAGPGASKHVRPPRAVVMVTGPNDHYGSRRSRPGRRSCRPRRGFPGVCPSRPGRLSGASLRARANTYARPAPALNRSPTTKRPPATASASPKLSPDTVSDPTSSTGGAAAADIAPRTAAEGLATMAGASTAKPAGVAAAVTVVATSLVGPTSAPCPHQPQRSSPPRTYHNPMHASRKGLSPLPVSEGSS